METPMKDLFASKVFNDAVMKARLPKDTYKEVRRAIGGGKRHEGLGC